MSDVGTSELEGAASAVFREAWEPSGGPREAWRGFLGVLESMGAGEFAVRAENGKRILREHGVSVMGPSEAGVVGERFWDLDFVPMMLGAGEWRTLVAGVEQRAQLLNTVLGDLHGVQRLVRDGFIPAPLLYANPGYLRSCQAVRVPAGVYLHMYAVDLARGPDGVWRVLADRTQAPSGMGFALEGRTVTARVLPEAMRRVQPRPLGGVLAARRDALRGLAPSGTENPAVVLLTPGARHEAYFEHSYLARLMGFPLTEGEDLTVRDHRVWLKTLDELRPVDVVLRRVTDGFCDPLELRGESLLGVPGLVEVARAGRVAVANALGSGLLEGPGFLPLLPALCRHLLGEELRLESVPTWWCGRRDGAELVRRDEVGMEYRSAFGTAPRGLPGEAEARLEAVRVRPHEWVVQQRVALSRAPSWVEGIWVERPVVVRLFAVHDGTGYVVMPGGIARVMEEESAASLALSLGGVCKDVWVLPDAGEERALEVGPVHSVAQGAAQDRAVSDLPSRTADNFFWLGRYAERLEQVARMARTVVGRLADDVGPGSEVRVGALERLSCVLLETGVDGVEDARVRLQGEMMSLLEDGRRVGGVVDLMGRIHLSAFAVRYRLSADTWRILNRLGPGEWRVGGRLPLVGAAALLNRLVLDLSAFAGMEMENMTRGHGWVFLDLGRRLERGKGLTHLLEAVVRQRGELELVFEPVLEMADSVMTYRRIHFAQPRLDGVVDLLLHEAANPRSVAFQLARLAEHAAGLPDGLNPLGVAQVRERVSALAGELAGSRGREVEVEEVEAMLAGLRTGLLELSDLVTQVYFSHVTPRVS